MSEHPFYWPDNPEPVCQYCEAERPTWQLSDASWVCDPCCTALRAGYEPVREQPDIVREHIGGAREWRRSRSGADELHARVATLETALQWVRHVHPRTTRDGSKGAIVTMTRGEFDAMRVALGMRPLFQRSAEPSGSAERAPHRSQGDHQNDL